MVNELKPHDVIIDNLLVFDDDCYFDDVVFQSLLFYVLSTEYILTLLEMCVYVYQYLLPATMDYYSQSLFITYITNKNNVDFSTH